MARPHREKLWSRTQILVGQFALRNRGPRYLPTNKISSSCAHRQEGYRKLNPDLFLFSSPWSPPGWMKFNRSMLGGTIRKSNLEPYSRYFQKFLEAYKAEGVGIDAITVQNEVDTTVDGRYAACQWSQEDEILFVSKYLGPLFRNAGISTKIWVLDHNFTLWGRAIAELSDPR